MDEADHAPEVESPVPYRPHVGQSRQYIRDIILGCNDGLVSTFLLVAGVVGGGLTTDDVLLTATAGAVAGAVSMAAGEYLATRSQEEVFDREINLEQEHIEYFRHDEVEQLRDFFDDVGVHEEDIPEAMAIFSRDNNVLLNTMKVFEFGVVESERRNAVFAMVMSGLLFLVGAMPSTLPFAFAATPQGGLLWAAILSACGLFAVGVAKTRVTDGSPLASGMQNLLIAAIGGGAAYAIGVAFDAVVG